MDDFEFRDVDNDETKEVLLSRHVSFTLKREHIVQVSVVQKKRTRKKPTSCWLCWPSLSLHDFEFESRFSVDSISTMRRPTETAPHATWHSMST